MKRLIKTFFTLFLVILMLWGTAGCELGNDIDEKYDDEETEEIEDKLTEAPVVETTAPMVETTTPVDPSPTTQSPPTTEAPAVTIAPEKSSVDSFFELLNTGNYLEASRIYNEKISGNYYDEVSVYDGIINIIEGINQKILTGEYKEKDVYAQGEIIGKLLDNTSITIEDEILDLWDAKLTASLDSKAAYSAAVEFEALKQYADAIAQYRLVIQEDPNYSAATEAIKRCATAYKEDSLAKAQNSATAGDYAGAMKILNEVAQTLPNDNDVKSKITVYKTMHIRAVLSNAEAVFVIPTEDYSKALDIINSALQLYKDDSQLMDAYSYYASYAPINLYYLPQLNGEADKLDTDADIYGNDYTHCFWSGYGSWAIWYETDITYNLSRNYNTFSATVYSRSTKNEAQYMIVEIYADDKLVYQNLNVADNSIKPFDIELNITGVEKLRIVLSRDRGAIGSGIGMTDMIIQRTVK